MELSLLIQGSTSGAKNEAAKYISFHTGSDSKTLTELTGSRYVIVYQSVGKGHVLDWADNISTCRFRTEVNSIYEALMKK